MVTCYGRLGSYIRTPIFHLHLANGSPKSPSSPQFTDAAVVMGTWPWEVCPAAVLTGVRSNWSSWWMPKNKDIALFRNHHEEQACFQVLYLVLTAPSSNHTLRSPLLSVFLTNFWHLYVYFLCCLKIFIKSQQGDIFPQRYGNSTNDYI